MNQSWFDEHEIPAAVDEFIPGERCTWDAATLETLAAILAKLHSAPPLPAASNSLWHPLKHELLAACPTSIIHADIWQGNVIESKEGQLVLIDWEHAGIGHSVIDLASLLSDCETDALIDAVLRSYSSRRPLSARERKAIVPAIEYTVRSRIELKKRLGRGDSLDREYRRLERASRLRL